MPQVTLRQYPIDLELIAWLIAREFNWQTRAWKKLSLQAHSGSLSLPVELARSGYDKVSRDWVKPDRKIVKLLFAHWYLMSRGTIYNKNYDSAPMAKGAVLYIITPAHPNVKLAEYQGEDRAIHVFVERLLSNAAIRQGLMSGDPEKFAKALRTDPTYAAYHHFKPNKIEDYGKNLQGAMEWVGQYVNPHTRPAYQKTLAGAVGAAALALAYLARKR